MSPGASAGDVEKMWTAISIGLCGKSTASNSIEDMRLRERERIEIETWGRTG